MIQPYVIQYPKKILVKGNHIKFVTRESCISREEVYIWWILNHGTESYCDVSRHNVFEAYAHEDSFLATLKALSIQLQAEWKRHLHEYPKKKNAVFQAAKAVSQSCSFKKRNVTTILKAFDDYNKKAYEFCEYIFGAWAVIYFIEPEVLQQLGDHAETITALTQPIVYQNMLNDLFRFTGEAWLAKYQWLNMYSVYDHPYTMKDYVKLRQQTNKQEMPQQKAFSQAEQRYRQFLNTLDITLKQKVEIVHTYSFLKTDRIDTWKEAMFLLQPFYQYLATKANISLALAANCCSKEIKEFLTKGTIPEKLNQRTESSAIYHFLKGRIFITYDQRVVKKTITLLEKPWKSIKQITGIVACRGKAQGPVKIISHSDDLAKVNNGDIFVATYTFPTFTPTMAKCAAIVTDEGGLTSHAAVIAREMHIPCIVGTKIATKILHDGDAVEVDAERGVVRRIS